MKKIIFALTIAVSFNLVFALTMSDSFLNSVEKAKKLEVPLLIYFYTDDNQQCEEFDTIINAGYLDFLEENFIVTRMDVNNAKNSSYVQKYNIRSIPLFVLIEYNPKRQSKINTVGIEAMNLFKALFEMYSYLSSEFISVKDYDTAYGCLKLIENLPESFGIEVKKAIKEIEPNVKNKISTKKKDDNIAKAESYMKTAESNLKNEKYEKAYLYFDKVIELAPNTELSERAKIEKNKIKDLVDKSVILK